MKKINYLDIENKLINNQFKEKCILINGELRSGKTTLAIKKYKHMIDIERISSDNILVLFTNKYQGLKWEEECVFQNCNSINKFSYFGFIKKELTKYWPIVLKKCSCINKNILRPKFVSFDVSKYMMELLIKYFRKNKGYFEEITSSFSRITLDLIYNMNISALSLIPFSEIGDRLYNSLENKTFFNKKTYDEMDKIIEYYSNRFLNEGFIDYSLSVYLYNKYLLYDEIYNSNLKKNIKYIIVDDFQESSPAQIELIKEVIKKINNAYLFSNFKGSFSSYFGADEKYILDNFNVFYKQIDIDKNFINNSFSFFINSIEKRILNNTNIKLKEEIPVFIDVSSELRSEMIEKILNNIENLLKEGIEAKDIVIISPFNDLALLYKISNKLKNNKVPFISTSRKERLIDNPYVHSLIVLACFCHNYTDIKLTIDDYRNFFSFVLQLDLIRSSLIAKEVMRNGCSTSLQEELLKRLDIETIEKYEFIKTWIEKSKQDIIEKPISLDEFFRKAYTEIILKIPNAIHNISICKDLIELSENFIKVLDNFNTIEKPEEKFIQFIQTEALDFYYLRELGEKLSKNNGIILTNPNTFLTSNLASKIQIWIDINSNMWCPRNIKELTNSYVLRNTWNSKDIYTEKLENKNKYKNLIKVIKGLLKKCDERLYIYGSNYSLRGYEEETEFSKVITDILSESEVNK